MSISMFVLYALAFVSGAFILIVVCAVIGAYLEFRDDLLDYAWPTGEGGVSINPLILFVIVAYCYLFLVGKNDYRCYNFLGFIVLVLISSKLIDMGSLEDRNKYQDNDF